MAVIPFVFVNAPNKKFQPTIYAVFALWSRCRSTLPQGKHRINCD